MTREQTINILYGIRADNLNLDDAYTKDKYEALGMAIKALEQEPCEDVISRKSIKHKLQEHHDFFVNAYGGFSNLSQNDKSRVDEIINCIAMVVNEPSVTPQEPIDYKAQYEEFSKKAEIVISQLRADRDRLLETLDKIRAEIDTKYGQCKLCEFDSDYDGVYTDIGDIADILQIIDKYKAETEEV